MSDSKKELFSFPVLSRLDVIAIAFATMLSISCLARGAVYDAVIALLLLLSLPILWHALRSVGQVHTTLKVMGITVFATVALITFVQYSLHSTGESGVIWHHVSVLTGHEVPSLALHDKAAFFQSIGRVLFFVGVFAIALCIGTSESSARIFLQALLMSGTVCLGITYFIATSEGVPTSTFYSYTHGFVNPNSAASYLGIMLLLGVAQAVRFFRLPFKSIYRELPQLLDQLTLASILNGCFILFAVLVSLACLFMTGSRAGIFLSLLCAILFFIMILLKMDLSTRMRKVAVTIGGLVLLMVLVWSFLNFGQIITHKLSTDGINSNWRLDIFSSVLPMIGDHRWIGVGMGSFASVFQQYRPTNLSSDGIIDKAHNSYLEFGAEMGLPALIVLLVVLGWVGYTLFKGIKHRQERYVVPALGLAVWLFVGLHSLADFPLQIPGIMAIFIALMAVCVSQTDPRFCHHHHMHSTGAATRRIRTRKRRSPNKFE